MSRPIVGVVMGSDSDWPVLEAAAIALGEFGIPYEADVVSAHRMPEDMSRYGREAAARVRGDGTKKARHFGRAFLVSVPQGLSALRRRPVWGGWRPPPFRR